MPADLHPKRDPKPIAIPPKMLFIVFIIMFIIAIVIAYSSKNFYYYNL